MRVHHERCCGIDVHKRSVTACLLWGPAGQEPRCAIRRFGTMTADLRALAAWLTEAGCQLAAMESTGSYWKPVWNILEEHLPLLLANAKHVRALPGEKTDRKDGRRLADLLRHGLGRASVVPPRDLRNLRDLTRYRTKLLGNGAAERNRIQKFLEDANIKLGSVLSDVFGASGQRLLQAVLAGQRVDLAEVVRLTHWRLTPKVEQIHRALDGQLTDHHRFVIETCLDHMRYIEQQIVRLDERIAQYLTRYGHAPALLQTMPGLAEHSAATVLAEIGPDMAVFDDADHLASWTGICPGTNESAGTRFSGKTRKGNPFLRATLVDCAWGATRKQHSQFRATYYRIKARRGSKRAIVAVAHELLRVAYVVLQTGEPYTEPAPRLLPERTRHRKANTWPAACVNSAPRSRCNQRPRSRRFVFLPDVRVVQGGDGARLALEPLLQLEVGGDVLGQHPNGDGAIPAGVSGSVDFTHTAGAEGAWIS